MKQFRDFSDERTKFNGCVFCGGEIENRDHIPSRVFLERPYPENLPVVPSCRKCNQSFSLDEEYLACLVECAKNGSVEAASMKGGKAAKILRRQQLLKSRLISARLEQMKEIYWKPEYERVLNIVLKLARGHAAFELGEPFLDNPSSVNFIPLCSMASGVRVEFEQCSWNGFWPEVGTRGMQRMVNVGFDLPWIEVQQDKYRYLVNPRPPMVRIVIAEYLTAEVIWD